MAGVTSFATGLGKRLLRRWEFKWIGILEEDALKIVCPGTLWRPEWRPDSYGKSTRKDCKRT
jgi:hypothetical protein